jgi:hypothetical protein
MTESYKIFDLRSDSPEIIEQLGSKRKLLKSCRPNPHRQAKRPAPLTPEEIAIVEGKK